MTDDLNEKLKALINTWCDRKEYYALSIVLPWWLENNHLTDGWGDLRDALKHANVMLTHLPSHERGLLKQLYVEIDYALDYR